MVSDDGRHLKFTQELFGQKELNVKELIIIVSIHYTDSMYISRYLYLTYYCNVLCT